MGISKELIEILFRGHVKNTLQGRVLLAGRQTVPLQPEQAHQMALDFGVTPPHAFDELEIDETTRGAAASRKDYITDRALFSLMGLDDVVAVDVSDYEGAEFVHDLCTHLPKGMHEIADIVIDGSTLDNVFDPVTALRSLVDMTRPGGTIFLTNTGSDHSCPYLVLTPLWFLDYFVMNRFSACSVYVIARNRHEQNVMMLDPAKMRHGAPYWTQNVNAYAPHRVMLIVTATKGETSTSNVLPVQHQYRSDKDYATYLDVLSRWLPIDPLIRSKHLLFASEIPQGYTYIPKDADA